MAVPMLDPDRLTVFDPSVLPPPRANVPTSGQLNVLGNKTDGETIPDGSRNATLASRAGQMRRMGFSEPEIVAALLVVNERCTPPLPEDEVSSIARSVATYPPERPAQVLADHGRELRLIDDVEMINRPEPPALVEGMVLAGSLSGIFSPAGRGKTVVATHLGVCVTTGRAFFGAPVAEPGNVVHVLGEGAGRFGARLKAAKLEFGIDPETPLGYYTLPESIDISNAAGLDQFITAARPVGPQLVFLDTVNLKRPRFSWTRIKGESNVQGGGGNGSVEERGTGRGIGATGVRADGAAAGAGSLAPGQRWSASRKRDVVLRLLRGESLEALSREVGVEIYRLEAWRARAMAGLELGLKDRHGEPVAEMLDAAKRHIGELSMEIELLRERAQAVEQCLPLAMRRSRR